MLKGSNWFSLPKKEMIFLITFITIVTIAFLPWSYDITFLNVTLLAWVGYALQILVPLTLTLLILSDK